jgi:hypothetical protein
MPRRQGVSRVVAGKEKREEIGFPGKFMPQFPLSSIFTLSTDKDGSLRCSEPNPDAVEVRVFFFVVRELVVGEGRLARGSGKNRLPRKTLSNRNYFLDFTGTKCAFIHKISLISTNHTICVFTTTI